MKRLLSFLPLLLLAVLLLFPSSALSGTRQGLTVWGSHVLPSLLPSLICVKLAQELGLLQAAYRHPKWRMAVVVGFSLVSGAPNGAKLLRAMEEDSALPFRDGQQLLPFVNSVSPMFLLFVIASELLKNMAMFLPIAVAFYSCILCFVLPQLLQKREGSLFSHTNDQTFSQALSSAIESSVLDMLRIGGCILFACTMLSVFCTILPFKTACAALAGFMEVSTGVSIIAETSLSLRLKTSLLTGCAAFGGLSLALQTACCYPGLRLVPYLFRKLLLGALTGLACYLIFPLFPSVSTVFAGRQEVLTRSLSLSALLLSSALSAAFMFVLSLMVSHRKSD